MFERIGILGCGTIGSSWAAFFALKGLPVYLYDRKRDALKSGLHLAARNISRLRSMDGITSTVAEDAVARLIPAESLKSLAAISDFVQESVAEDYGVKAEVYRQLEDDLSPRAVIASSSSGLLMTRLQRALKYPDRSLIAHPFNPPHIIPLVELVPGRYTDPAVVSRVREFFQRLGKRPVVLQKEVPGHIANRLAAAVWREALSLLQDGVATLEDIDRALTSGPGLRWSLMGQHQLYDLGGGEGGYAAFIDKIGRSFTEYWRDMQCWEEIPAEARHRAITGCKRYYEKRSREEWLLWRDRKLLKLIEMIGDD